MPRPEITLEAKRADEQPGPISRLMLGAPMGTEIWHVKVTCPHGTNVAVVAVGLHGACSIPGHDHTRMSPDDLADHAATDACKLVREAHFQQAPCGCSEPYWAQHGPLYEMPSHLGSTQLVGHAKGDCFSAN